MNERPCSHAVHCPLTLVGGAVMQWQGGLCGNVRQLALFGESGRASRWGLYFQRWSASNIQSCLVQGFSFISAA